jgi:hypothetical protein
MKFEELYSTYKWRSLRNCPGRYALIREERERFIPFYNTLNNVEMYHVPKAVDTVLVFKLEDGGLISYRKPDGSILHTLGDAFGFRKKMDELGI